MKQWTEAELKAMEADRNRREEYPEDQTRRLFKENAPLAASTICELATGMDVPPRIQLQAATYVVDRVLGRITDPTTTEDDPYQKLMKQVTQTNL